MHIRELSWLGKTVVFIVEVPACKQELKCFWRIGCGFEDVWAFKQCDIRQEVINSLKEI
jgi:hypothetical protein